MVAGFKGPAGLHVTILPAAEYITNLRFVTCGLHKFSRNNGKQGRNTGLEASGQRSAQHPLTVPESVRRRAVVRTAPSLTRSPERLRETCNARLALRRARTRTPPPSADP